MTDAPHWERGYRCHGYWLGAERIGFVGLPPGSASSYGWSFDLPADGSESGRVMTLRAAKRAVEKAYKHYRENS